MDNAAAADMLNDRREDVPKLLLELELGAELTESSDCQILGTLRRADSDKRPCLFLWSQVRNAFNPDGFQLFRHTDSGLRKIEISDDVAARSRRGPNDTIVMVQNAALRELFTDGHIGKSRYIESFPKRYREKLVKGYKYELVWPGGQVERWDWGTVLQHYYQELGIRTPSLYIPPAQCTIEFDKFGPPRREPTPPIDPSQRVQVLACKRWKDS
jgi:hypothetical protein